MAVFAMTLSCYGDTLPSPVTRLEMETKPVCRIAYDRGKPYFDIGGRRYEAALYNVSQFWNGSNPRLRKQIGYFRDAGMHLYGLGVNTPDAWKSDGSIDFELALRPIKSALELDPDAYFLYSINTVLPPRWWVERNPDELVGYANGKVSIDERECMRNCAAGSAASAVWRRNICDFQRRLVAYIESTPYADRIFAYRTDWGVNHEWHYYGMFGYMPDNGKAMTAAFRNWLRKSYGGDVSALRTAWMDDKVSFETAETPSVEMRRRKSAAPLRDPVLDRAVIDYERCHAEVLRDFLLESNRSVKEACGGRALVGNYGGYYFGVSAPAEGWHLENDAVLDSPYVDFQCSPQIYGEEARRLGAGQYARCLLEGLRRRGKLSIQEADKATSTSGSRYSRWTDNREDDLAILARDFVQTLCWGCGFWYFDFGYGFYSDPVYADFFRRIYEIRRESADCSSVSEVLVVGDYESVMFSHVDWPATGRGELITRQVNALANAGVPFDSASFKDLASGTLRDYKVYILPNFNYVTPEKAAVIDQIRKRGGKVVWIGKSGIAKEEDCVFENPATREELLMLFRKVGVHVYCDEDDSAVYACASYIGFHCAKSGRKIIRLPHPVKVAQIYPERRPMGIEKELSFEASGASTFLFRVEGRATSMINNHK